ncbi:uncharacterized protein [Haliotis cracherodii]|uniref:uncharacterized protein n=1 Tax=Haliotis cracherodii TaxID=6455 RepID=UPI0039ECA0E6
MVDSHLPRSHFESLLTKMNQDRQEGRFCDVQLTVSSRHIPVHRSVLAACSPYFSGMFSGNFLESDKGMTTVDLSDAVDEMTHLDTVISSLYSGQLHLDRSNIAPVTQLVSFLMIDSLKELCVQFLMNDIQLQTSVNYFVLADMYDIEEVENYAFSILESRFHDYFIYQEEVLQVSPHHLCILFQRSIQRYCDSSQILKLLFSWAAYKDVSRRLSTAKELFHSMCVGLDEQGLKDMDAWLEAHKDESETVTRDFSEIVKGVMTDQEMQDDAVKTPDDTGEYSLHNGAQSLNQDCSPFSGSSSLLVPEDGSSRSSGPPLTPTTVVPSELQLPSRPVESTNPMSSSFSDCVVVMAPTREVVQSILEVDFDQKKILSSTCLDVSFYKSEQKIWLNLGTVTFPGILDEKSNWRTCCTHDKIYFLSPIRGRGYRLDLVTRVWQTLDCRPVLEGLEGDVRSVIPLAVNNSLYVLASNRLLSDTRDHYQTQQRYYRLTDQLTWEPVAEVSHDHYSTPLSLISVSGSKIFVVKADIAVNVAKNLLIIKEGHTFDTSTNVIEKFAAVTYVPSPVRVMVREGTIYIIDGDGWMRGYNKEKSQWEFPVQVDLSDIRWCRASSIEGHFPCLSHVSTGAGGCVWELSSFQHHATALLEVGVGNGGGLHTRIHIPPPYKYFAIATAGKVSNSVLKCLSRSHFVHD